MVHVDTCQTLLLMHEICFKTSSYRACKKVYFCQTIENCEIIKESLQNRITKAHANGRKRCPYHTESQIRKQRHFVKFESLAVLSIYSKSQNINERYRSYLQISDVQKVERLLDVSTYLLIEALKPRKFPVSSVRIFAGRNWNCCSSILLSLKHKNWKYRERL